MSTAAKVAGIAGAGLVLCAGVYLIRGGTDHSEGPVAVPSATSSQEPTTSDPASDPTSGGSSGTDTPDAGTSAGTTSATGQPATPSAPPQKPAPAGTPVPNASDPGAVRPTASPRSTWRAPVVVPKVEGMTLDKAMAAMRNEGVTGINLAYAGQAKAPYGTIVTTAPLWGTKLNPGQSVTLYSPAPAESATMPNLTGMTWTQAIAALNKANIQPTGIKTAEQPGTPSPGEVVSSQPGAGVKVTPQDKIVVSVVVGKQSEVPDVVGTNVTLAFRLLLDAGFTAEFSDTSGKWNHTSDWYVTKSSIEAGSKARMGGSVTLQIKATPAAAARTP